MYQHGGARHTGKKFVCSFRFLYDCAERGYLLDHPSCSFFYINRYIYAHLHLPVASAAAAVSVSGPRASAGSWASASRGGRYDLRKSSEME